MNETPSTSPAPWEAATLGDFQPDPRPREEERAAFIRGLRELADYIEVTPAFPLPAAHNVMAFAEGNIDAQRATLVELARSGGRWEKNASDSYFELSRRFGSIPVVVMADHESVCVRKVVGQRITHKPDPAAVAELPKVPVVVDEVEWVCPPSLLALDVEEPGA